MAVTTTGNVVDTIATDGDLWVGNTGTGTLTVNGGSVKSVTAAGTASVGADARLWVGKTATGNGTVTVSGTNSVLEVVSGGRPDAGGTAQIGRGGTGSLKVEAGATFRVIDTVGTAFTYSTGDGNEAINVGRDADGNGTLTADNGHVVISGTASRFNIGRDGGTGTASFTNNSTLDMSSTIAAADTGLAVGRGGGNGSLLLFQSSATLTAGGAAATSTEDYGAYVHVGRDAGSVGTLTLQNGASLTLSGDSNLPGTPGSYTTVYVGRDGGAGTMTLGGSTVTLNNSPEGAYFWVGRSSLTSGTTTGTLGLTASTITLDSTNYALLGIGRGTGTNGTATLYAASTVTVQGDLGATLMVGTANNSTGSTGGTGTLNINSLGGAASTVTIQSDNAGTFAAANIGQYGGTGTINIDGGTLRMQGAGASYMQIGVQGDGTQPGSVAAGSAGTGSLILTNGARFEMIDGSTNGGLTLGGGVGTATMEIRSGSVAHLDDDATGSTYVAVGSGIAGSGVATLLVNGAGSLLDGASYVNVGRNNFNVNSLGGNGRLIIENGGKVVADNGVTIGTGGRLSGDGGTLQVKAGGYVTVAVDGALGDTGGAIQKLTLLGNLTLQSGADVKVDISSTTSDQIAVQASGTGTGQVFIQNADYTLNVLGGYKFTAGSYREFFTATDASGMMADFNTVLNSTVTINGQHADFAYYLGTLTDGHGAGGLGFGIKALNSGASGGDATLDFGASSLINANYVYDAAHDNARVYGGVFANNGGIAHGVDIVLGTAGVDTLDASAATQAMVLDGGANNDILKGGAGADIIRGGTGIDTMTGNGGADVFYSSASDLTAGIRDTVTDYTAADQLRFSGVDSNFLHVAASGSDTLIGIDVTGGQAQILLAGSKTDVTVVFGPAPASLTSALANDYANTTIKVFDIGNIHSYTTLTTVNDALARVDIVDMLNDDGTRVFTDFDQANARADASTRTVYDSLGRVDIVDVNNDDGSRVFTDFDQASARADASTLTAYDNLGRIDYVDVNNDDGTRVFTDFDQANARADTSTLTAYDNLGRVDYVDVRNDNGTRVFTDFDQANARADASTRTVYDSLGRIDIVDVINDDGSRIFTDFDQANADATASTRTVYDSLGRIDYIDIIRDDGTRQFTDLDQANIYSWSSVRTEYAANGSVISTTTIPD